MSTPLPTRSGEDVDLTTALHRYFGFSSFREKQEDVVRRVLSGRDTLAIMPTGAGKSLCYQLAAMLLPAPTLVISPLIALMKDQIDHLPPEIAARSSLINSSLEPAEAARRLHALASGQYRLIYAAPERLRQRAFVAALRGVGIGLVVIDEVHCVSMWGHDFRPDYLFIRTALEALGNPAILGMTATATLASEHDIAASLGRTPDVVRGSVVRDNLRYEIVHVDNEDGRQRAAVALARRLPGAGIIYARARDKCEQVAQVLRRRGVQAQHYHARLEPSERTRVQDQFLNDQSRVIVATTAFGMGIDKADIRWIVLYNFPNSLESYVQMVGRAGRDGATSTCVLFASKSDASNVQRFARADIPTVEQLRAVYRQLRTVSVNRVVEITAEELASLLKLEEKVDPRVLVGMLERTGMLRRDFDAGRAMRIHLLSPPPDAAHRVERLLHEYETQANDRTRAMIAFAETDRCRHLQVAEHFGEKVRVPCGACDLCAPDEDDATTENASVRPLPANIAHAILDAVDSMVWPLGLSGLVSALRGSPDAPPSSLHSPAFGILESAREAYVKRWVTQLVDGGHLVSFESRDGYRLLRVGRRSSLPVLHHPVVRTMHGRTVDRDTAATEYRARGGGAERA